MTKLTLYSATYSLAIAFNLLTLVFVGATFSLTGIAAQVGLPLGVSLFAKVIVYLLLIGVFLAPPVSIIALMWTSRMAMGREGLRDQKPQPMNPQDRGVTLAVIGTVLFVFSVSGFVWASAQARASTSAYTPTTRLVMAVGVALIGYGILTYRRGPTQ
jgi:hypothetical protein